MAKQQPPRSRRSLPQAGRRPRVTWRINQLVPASARTHLGEARRELLLAVRDVLDHAIGRLETAARSRRLRRVRVE